MFGKIVHGTNVYKNNVQEKYCPGTKISKYKNGQNIGILVKNNIYFISYYFILQLNC